MPGPAPFSSPLSPTPSSGLNGHFFRFILSPRFCLTVLGKNLRENIWLQIEEYLCDLIIVNDYKGYYDFRNMLLTMVYLSIELLK